MAVRVAEHSLNHPFQLAWMHRKHMRTQLERYDWFLSVEGDTLVPACAMATQVAMAPLLWQQHSMLLGFVRVVNDTGLIMTYYLRTDADQAERYLLDAVADGAVQIQAEMGEQERYDLAEAWGDAHQNMGILEMTMRGNPAPAREWFVKALEIGPPSREWLRTDVLPLLDRWIEEGARPAALDEIEARTVWAHRP